MNWYHKYIEAQNDMLTQGVIRSPKFWYNPNTNGVINVREPYSHHQIVVEYEPQLFQFTKRPPKMKSSNYDDNLIRWVTNQGWISVYMEMRYTAITASAIEDARRTVQFIEDTRGSVPVPIAIKVYNMGKEIRINNIIEKDKFLKSGRLPQEQYETVA